MKWTFHDISRTEWPVDWIIPNGLSSDRQPSTQYPGTGAPGWLIRIDWWCWTCFGQTRNPSNELSKGGVIFRLIAEVIPRTSCITHSIFIEWTRNIYIESYTIIRNLQRGRPKTRLLSVSKHALHFHVSFGAIASENQAAWTNLPASFFLRSKSRWNAFRQPAWICGMNEYVFVSRPFPTKTNWAPT